MPTVVSLVIERNGAVLLARRSSTKDHAPGQWESISGRVEPGESFIEAARREAMEETGLEIEVVRELDAFTFERGPTKEHTAGVTFHCRAVHERERMSQEHDKFVWVTLGEAKSFGLPEGLLRCIAVVLGQHSKAPNDA